MENPIKMDDLGVPLFLETPIYTFSTCLVKQNIHPKRASPWLSHFEDWKKYSMEPGEKNLELRNPSFTLR